MRTLKCTEIVILYLFCPWKYEKISQVLRQNFSLLLGLLEKPISGKNRNFESFTELCYNHLVSQSIIKFHVSCAMVYQRKSTKNNFQERNNTLCKLGFQWKESLSDTWVVKIAKLCTPLVHYFCMDNLNGQALTQWIQSLYKVAIPKDSKKHEWTNEWNYWRFL